MADIIQLLPDSVANQIAAGEVIQRPASVVKEFIENSIDAGSTSIKVIIKDAGKTLIQIIDNGCGMSDTDARLSFERHATSKIRNANDLFSIRTMGFRGEALASIAAVAQVSLKTRQQENELGTEININGSEFESQKEVSCPPGTNISVKNLFFNIPARRKFLKTNATEFKHIVDEFQRAVLCNPDIEFSLYHNNSEEYNLPAANLRQRIIHTLGKTFNSRLLTIKTETSIIKITGFIGKPEFAKKKFGDQFFFINKRFMKHPYFHKAVMLAYDQIIAPDTLPAYFLYFETDPSFIDINIHPTKTEIKFEDEQAIWQILNASTKETLGKSNIVPSIDFDKDGIIEIPAMKKDREVEMPEIRLQPEYNPFDNEKPSQSKSTPSYQSKKEDVSNWEDLYAGKTPGSFDTFTIPSEEKFGQKEIDHEESSMQKNSFQFKEKYIFTPVKSGLMIIDQKRAHERILFEKYLISISENTNIAQQRLYPQKLELSPGDYAIMTEIANELQELGFDISDLGNNVIAINACPADTTTEPSNLVENLIQEYQNKEKDLQFSIKESLAKSMAKASAIPYGKKLNVEEMRILIDQLFACGSPNYSPDGKLIISIINNEEIEKRF